MVKFTAEELHKIMDFKHNIRNVTVIAHVDHGKTTLIDSLVAAAGIIPQETAGDVRVTDTRADEAERGISIKSTGITLYYHMSDEALKTFKGERNGNNFIVNLIDSPGHIDFSCEVTAALRITDGSLVVVDCNEGVCVQTESVLRQALGERICPILTVNKVDKFFLDSQLDGEEVYQKFLRVIESTNAIINGYEDPVPGDVMLDPSKGTVAFSDALHGWAFTVSSFARMYCAKWGVHEPDMMRRLWGDNYFDFNTRKWTKQHTGSPTCKRGFIQFCYDPVKQVIDACMNDDKDHLWGILSKINVTLKASERDLMGTSLMKRVMQSWLPASTALFEMMIFHLPSPVTAQSYRVEKIYKGPLDDPYANAIRNCDPNGPLMLYISKMIPSSDRGRFFAFGRVFSGKISTGQKVRIMGPNYIVGETRDLYMKSVQRTLIWMGKKHEIVHDVPCGNTVAIAGLDDVIRKSATITNVTAIGAHIFNSMRFTVAPVVRVAVKCENVSDLPKLVEGVRRLSISDPLVLCLKDDESKEYIIGSAGELHLEVCLKDLKEEFMDGAPIKITDPIVSFRETVLEQSRVSVLSSSPNLHNSLLMESRPLEEGLPEAIEEGRLGPRENINARANLLHEEFGWSRIDGKKIRCFGPDSTGPNLVVDGEGVNMMGESQTYIVQGFDSALKEGALAGEQLRGVRFDICEAVLHRDSAFRGASQLIPMAREAIHGTQLAGKPRLVEPVYLVYIKSTAGSVGSIQNLLEKRRGKVHEVLVVSRSVYEISAYLPVVESFGFSAALLRATSGRASLEHYAFDHWNTMLDDPTDTKTVAGAHVAAIRRRKGLVEQVTSV